MLQCPMCSETFSTITFHSWVVCARGSAKVDHLGKLSQIGPLRATTTIKQGHELEGYLAEITCPCCNYSGPPKVYRIIVPCALTGGSSNAVLSTVFGDIAVNRDSLEEARRVFTDAALEAIEPLRVEDMP